MSRDQYTLTDPTTLYADIITQAQSQDGPGLDAELREKADHGEDSYRGTGRLDGRKALITGGDSGIGAAVAIAFAREGADVAISYLPEEEEDAQRDRRSDRGCRTPALALPGDLKDPAYCRDIVEQTVATFGGLDILVNNGGKQQFHEDLAEINDEQFDDTMKTNVYALFWITRAAIPHLAAGVEHHQHLIDPGLLPVGDPRRLRDHQGRHQHLLQGAVPTIRTQGHPGQRRCAGTDLDPACRPPAASRRRSCRSSASRPRWAAPVSRPNWLRRTCSSPPPSPAT